MKRKIVLGSILTLTLMASVALAAVATTLANSPDDPLRKTYGSSGVAIVQLPSNSSYPAPLGSKSNHPTTLMFIASDSNRHSTGGAADSLAIFMWSPLAEEFTPIAEITDNAETAAFAKILWNGTYVWYPNSLPVPPVPNLFPNVILVEDKELDVWTESSWSQSGNGRWSWDEYGRYTWNTESGNLMVNLNKTMTIKLSSFRVNATGPSPSLNMTFNLPPLTLAFRGIGNGFQDEDITKLTGWTGASGYTIKTTANDVPAWVRISIPDWLKGTSYEVTGHIAQQRINTYIPPAT